LPDGLTLKARRNRSSSVEYSTNVLYEEADLNAYIKPIFEIQGSAEDLRYRLISLGISFGSAFDALSPPDRLFRDRTLESWLRQLPADPAELTGRRFQLRGVLLVPAGIEDRFTFIETVTDQSVRPGRAETVSTIIDQKGLISDELKDAFAVGKEVQVEFRATQEYLGRLHTTVSSVYRGSPGAYYVYWDYVYKAFLFIEAVPVAASEQPSIEGKVTDSAGAALSNALVILRQKEFYYATLTDYEGNFRIAAVEREPLIKGHWPIMCGNASKEVVIDSGVTSVYLSGTRPEFGRNLTLGQETVLSN
jgi:hypothetical protein